MNKRLLVFAAILIGSAAIYGQSDRKKLQRPPVDSLTGKISYCGEIRDIQAASKMELFSRALEWVKQDFPAASQCVIHLQDQENGKIAARALIHYSFGSVNTRFRDFPEYSNLQDEYIEFTVSILIQEGGYSYVMTDFNPLTGKAGSKIATHGFPPNPGNQPSEGVDSVKLERIRHGDYNSSYTFISSTAEDLIASLKSAMAKD